MAETNEQKSQLIFDRVPSPGNAGEARCGHGAPPQDVGQHRGAVHALYHQGDDGGEFVFTQGVAERASPEHVVNGWVRVLVVGQVEVGHGEGGQLEGPQRVPPVLHVPRDGEQLGVGHPRGRGVDHDLVGRLEGDVVLLAERQGGQGTVLGVLHGALQGEGPGAAGQLLALGVVQAEAQDGVVGHDGGRHDAGGLGRREESFSVDRVILITCEANMKNVISVAVRTSADTVKCQEEEEEEAASWASLKIKEEEWMFFWIASSTVRNLNMSPAGK
ncbi:hypothetical protein F7725_011727 [Dissostichus mawsoni]|uniref:Uncharacterized protein n=1 Tax=Dissostichus mawsoni TaxID=36200 RepID=A0A7J5ZA19_DISMA|nr:hypothetical protein F7725_011727 [Dissostichus mawsoni]